MVDAQLLEEVTMRAFKTSQWEACTPFVPYVILGTCEGGKHIDAVSINTRQQPQLILPGKAEVHDVTININPRGQRAHRG